MKKIIRLTLQLLLNIGLIKFLQKLGINLLHYSFYSNIPNWQMLHKQTFWQEPRSMSGINGVNINEQINFAEKCVNSLADKTILHDLNIINHAINEQKEWGYGPIEADFLFSFICCYQPNKIIQIGSGVSTSIILRALETVNKLDTKIICIEPYPSNYLKKLAKNNTIELITEIAQNVPQEIFLDLNKNDLLFIDSTHTVKVGSEVNMIIHEILPRLNEEVFVHFHDIYFPFDYQRNIKSTMYFWNETSLLYAFLTNNNNYTIRFSQSMCHYADYLALKRLFPNYDPQENNKGLRRDHNVDGFKKHFPSATYLQVIRN